MSSEIETIKRDIPKHMRGLGLSALQHAQYHSAVYSFDNPHWAEFSVLQAAHAIELFIKARIAFEHPLLIFENLPRPENEKANKVSLKRLIQTGKTFQLGELPSRLAIVCNITLPNLDKFHDFVNLRNSIQHFLPDMDIDFSRKTLEFIYEVVDPFINKEWGFYAVDFNDDYEQYEYLLPVLIDKKIKFLVSDGLVKTHDIEFFEWPKRTKYYSEMKLRWDEASSRTH